MVAGMWQTCLIIPNLFQVNFTSLPISFKSYPLPCHPSSTMCQLYYRLPSFQYASRQDCDATHGPPNKVR